MIWQLTAPVIIFAAALYALIKKTDVFGGFMAGAKDGLLVLWTIVPALVTLLAALAMLRASGFMDAFAEFCRPAFALAGIPPE